LKNGEQNRMVFVVYMHSHIFFQTWTTSPIKPEVKSHMPRHFHVLRSSSKSRCVCMHGRLENSSIFFIIFWKCRRGGRFLFYIKFIYQ
jgi:hypothetical protein